MNADMTGTYRIGPFVLNARTCVLTEGSTPVPLGKRAVAVLATLVQSPQEFVPKSTIMESAWPGLIVEESNLAVQVSSIRRVLARAPGGATWIETLSGRGYRFVGPCASVSEGTPVAARGAKRSNLSAPLTSFVGRERETTELRALLARSRLVTLTGTGGVGKTRLAMHVADAMVPAYPDGVWLVELAVLRAPALVAQAVVAALDLEAPPGAPPSRALVGYLKERKLLLILDNAEHLIAPCAELVDALLRQCPKITVLITSRERVAVPGESIYRVPSLSLPDAIRDASAASVGDCESVRLFRERAQLQVAGLGVTDHNASVIGSICRHLDGIPLAIELAAARVRSMTVEEIDARLGHRFALLTGGARTVPPRQQTLRAAIDWSYDTLSENERSVFCAMAVFAGGWTLEAAQQVWADETRDRQALLDILTSLADKSLVLTEQSASATRFRLLETLQQYALERLHQTGSDADLRKRHLACFFELARKAEPQLTEKDQQIWLDRLECEHDNLRQALAFALGDDVERGLLLASALSRFWLVRGYLAEGRSWLARLLAASSGTDAAARARAHNWAGILAWKQGDYGPALASLEQSLALYRARGDRHGIGIVLSNQGLVAYERGDYATARTLHEESLAIDRETGDPRGVAISLLHLASLAMLQGDHRAARAMNEESLGIFRSLGDRGHVAHALRSLGNLCTNDGDHAKARELYDESLAICRELGDRSGIARALHGLGVTARYDGARDVADARLRDSLAICRELGDREGSANALRHLARIAASNGNPSAARDLQEEALEICHALGDLRGVAACVEGLADLESERGQFDRACRLWAATARAREEIGAPLGASERAEHQRSVVAARSALGVSAFEGAWQQGRLMNLEQAIALALESHSP